MTSNITTLDQQPLIVMENESFLLWTSNLLLAVNRMMIEDDAGPYCALGVAP